MKTAKAIALVLAAASTLGGCAKLPRLPRLNLDAPLQGQTDSPAWKQHVEQCASKHPGYNQMTNMYPDSRGQQRLC